MEYICYTHIDNKPYYITKRGLATAIQMQANLDRLYWRQLEGRFLAVALLRSFVSEELYNGRPVVKSEDIMRTFTERVSGFNLLEPIPELELSQAAVQAADKAFNDGQLRTYTSEANPSFIPTWELKSASITVGNMNRKVSREQRRCRENTGRN